MLAALMVWNADSAGPRIARERAIHGSLLALHPRLSHISRRAAAINQKRLPFRLNRQQIGKPKFFAMPEIHTSAVGFQ